MIEMTGMRSVIMGVVKSRKRMDARGAGSSSTRSIEPVDNWHVAWKKVLAHVDRTGKSRKLRIDKDGWLSARQVLMVAFVGNVPAAHVCFSVTPSSDACIGARLDSYGIEPRFCGKGIESELQRAVIEHAQALNCEKLTGFRLTTNWC
jgi:hypothetical protein